MVYNRSGHSGLKLPAIALGITHFDLANNYGPPPGSAEESMGRNTITRPGRLSRRTNSFD